MNKCIAFALPLFQFTSIVVSKYLSAFVWFDSIAFMKAKVTFIMFQSDLVLWP